MHIIYIYFLSTEINVNEQSQLSIS